MNFISYLREWQAQKSWTETYILGRNFERDLREVLREYDTHMLPPNLSGMEKEISTNYYT